ncbi:diguanylate cyclase (GGDEF) domain-containing protein [Pseudomonas sp. NFACC02]|uniref:GGDEF domain-containing protein n=1 Tax=Pseudomonas sp. NFACC02 TaxID=1566250 RepID=UPI0008C2B574|nr:diguanylate cyclase [Pseudomonas sp. NFACC02]SEQ97378.1 diguanylate cyclase (GGDEF) domain-containing protein [Pseudomonas sp. NFACC02]
MLRVMGLPMWFASAFVIRILPDTDKYGGGMFAERLRVVIEAHEIMHEGEIIRCTVSLGVADMNSPLNTYKTLIERADEALYASKKSGRNQVSLHQASSPAGNELQA